MSPASSDATFADLAPSLQRLLRSASVGPRPEQLPPSLSRLYFRASARLLNPQPSPGVDETLHRLGKKSQLTIRQFERGGHPGPKPLLLYLHGGGWTLGSSAAYRTLASLLVEETGCAVFSLDYRLAPECPFPAALDDAALGWRWLRQRQELWGWQDQPLVIGGDSAGANLATVLCRRLRDGGETRPDGQFLLYPVTDLLQETASYQRYREGFLLTKRTMDWFIANYLGAAEPRNPDLSPLRASDLGGLPPAFIALAGCDVLLDEGRAYAARLAASGVGCETVVFRDMIHGFATLLALEAPRAATVACADRLRHLFTNAGARGPAAFAPRTARSREGSARERLES